MVRKIVFISMSIFLVNCGNSAGKKSYIRKSDKVTKSYEIVINSLQNTDCSILDPNELLKLKGEQLICEVYNQSDFEFKKKNYLKDLKRKNKNKKDDEKLTREMENQKPEYTCLDQERHALRRRVSMGLNENKVLYSYRNMFFEASLEEKDEKKIVYLWSYEFDNSGKKINLETTHIEYDKLSTLIEESAFGWQGKNKDFSVSCHRHEAIEEEAENVNNE